MSVLNNYYKYQLALQRQNKLQYSKSDSVFQVG